jgi:hypothetical protein
LPDVRAFHDDKEVRLIDISGGGAHIILQNSPGAAGEGSIINLRFIFKKGEMTVDGKIVRRWPETAERDHVAIQIQGTHNIGQYIY